MLTADILVEQIISFSAEGIFLVTSDQLKRRLSELGIDWGPPHGFRIRDAEDGELSTSKPRLVKWKAGDSPNSKVGYSLSPQQSLDAFNKALAWAQTRSWKAITHISNQTFLSP
jgi:hypothetical protein